MRNALQRISDIACREAIEDTLLVGKVYLIGTAFISTVGYCVGDKGVEKVYCCSSRYQ